MDAVMDPTLQWIINIGALATALSAIIGLWIGAVKLWPHVKRGVAVASEVERLPEIAAEMKTQSETLSVIRHELFPNSGKSLRDQTNRLEAAFTEHLKQCPPTTQITINPGSAP